VSDTSVCKTLKRFSYVERTNVICKCLREVVFKRVVCVEPLAPNLKFLETLESKNVLFGYEKGYKTFRNTICCLKIKELTFLGAFTKLRKRLLTSSCLSTVRPRGTARLPLHGFSWKFVFEYFLKICWESSSFIKIRENNRPFTWRPMYIYVIPRWILLRLRNFWDKSCGENKNTCWITFFPKIVPFVR
jgi:hypothetical protein